MICLKPTAQIDSTIVIPKVRDLEKKNADELESLGMTSFELHEGIADMIYNFKVTLSDGTSA